MIVSQTEIRLPPVSCLDLDAVVEEIRSEHGQPVLVARFETETLADAVRAVRRINEIMEARGLPKFPLPRRRGASQPRYKGRFAAKT